MGICALGAIGMSVIQGTCAANASRMVVVDSAPDELEFGGKVAAMRLLDPQDYSDPVQQLIIHMTDGAPPTRSSESATMKQWSPQWIATSDKVESTIIDVADSGRRSTPGSFSWLLFRVNRDIAFGSVEGQRYWPAHGKASMEIEINVLSSVIRDIGFNDTNKAFDLIHNGKDIRSIIKY